MQVKDLVEELSLKVVCGENNLNKKIRGGYCADLLSIVMSSAREDDIWITLQGHPNIVAVSVLVGLSAIIVAEDSKIDEETVEKAQEEGVVILSTELNSFEVAGRIYELGVHGERDE